MLQLILTVLLSLVIGYYKDWEYGISAALGGLIGIVPEIFFLLFNFKGLKPADPAENPEKILRAFYLAESSKWILTGVLFTLSFQWSKLKPMPLFLVFIATQLAYFTIPWLRSRDL